MFGDSTKIITGVIALIAFVSFLGAAFVSLRSTLLRQTISDQKERILNLEGALADRKREVDELTAAMRLAEAQTEALKERLTHLEEIVSGRIDFSAISTELSHHHVEMVKRQDDQYKAICGDLRDLKKLLAAKRAADGIGDGAA